MSSFFKGAGYAFERFCAGISAEDSHFVAYGPNSKHYCFNSAIVDSFKFAIEQGNDQTLLSNNKAFFWRVFCEVRQHLPKKMRRHLRLIITLGTPLDYFFSSDFVFVLFNRFVAVDVTTVTYKEKSENEKKFKGRIFTPYHSETSGMVRFSRQIVSDLKEGELQFCSETYNQISGLLYDDCNHKVNSS